jgi:hypothetical protein
VRPLRQHDPNIIFGSGHQTSLFLNGQVWAGDDDMDDVERIVSSDHTAKGGECNAIIGQILTTDFWIG